MLKDDGRWWMDKARSACAHKTWAHLIPIWTSSPMSALNVAALVSNPV